MKKIVSFIIICMFILQITSCGSASEADNFTLIMPNNKSISLYMDREEVEKVIGDTYENNSMGMCIYEDYAVGYTDNKLTYIMINENIGNYKIKSGINFDTDIEKLKSENFIIISDDNSLKGSFSKFYSYNDNSYKGVEPSQITEERLPADMNRPYQYARIDFILNDSSPKELYICDAYIARAFLFDKE